MVLFRKAAPSVLAAGVLILLTISAWAQDVDPHAGLVDKLYLNMQDWVDGKKCQEKFAVPCSCNTDPVTKAQDQSKLELRNLYSQQEDAFFEKVRQKQLDESQCAASYLDHINQSRNVPNYNKQNTKNGHVDFMKSALQYATDQTPPDTAALETQKNILSQMYRTLPEIRKDQATLNQNAQKVKDLQSEMTLDDSQNADDTSPTQIREWLKKENLLDQQLTAAKKDLAASQQALKYAKESVWSGGNHLVADFLNHHIDTKMTESQFVNWYGDKDGVDSFQQKVVDKMISENNQRLHDLPLLKGNISHAAKVDFVNSGAALTEISDSELKPGQYQDFACYLEGVYGRGRSLVVKPVKKGIIIATSAAAVVATGGAALAPEVITAGTALEVGAAAGVIDFAVWQSDNTTCTDGPGVSSVVSSKTCDGVRAMTSPQDIVDIVTKEMNTRVKCFGGTTTAQASMAVLPFFGKIKGLVLARKALAAEEAAEAGDVAVEGASDLKAGGNAGGNGKKIVETATDDSGGSNPADLASKAHGSAEQIHGTGKLASPVGETFVDDGTGKLKSASGNTLERVNGKLVLHTAEGTITSSARLTSIVNVTSYEINGKTYYLIVHRLESTGWLYADVLDGSLNQIKNLSVSNGGESLVQLVKKGDGEVEVALITREAQPVVVDGYETYSHSLKVQFVDPTNLNVKSTINIPGQATLITPLENGRLRFYVRGEDLTLPKDSPLFEKVSLPKDPPTIEVNGFDRQSTSLGSVQAFHDPTQNRDFVVYFYRNQHHFDTSQFMKAMPNVEDRIHYVETAGKSSGKIVIADAQDPSHVVREIPVDYSISNMSVAPGPNGSPSLKVTGVTGGEADRRAQKAVNTTYDLN